MGTASLAMGPSLRVRPHRPTYMRLQKDHQKPAKKKRRRRREMPWHPAPVVAHRYSLPNTTPAPLTHMCVVKEGCGLMSIYYVCCPKLPVYNDTTTKTRASSERFTQSLFINEKVMNNQLLFRKKRKKEIMKNKN